ncbi:MAG: M99 family carboxypeptidase catalytic domain-containing protein [Arcobacteraceae bacterium]
MNLGMSLLFKVVVFLLLIQNVYGNVKSVGFDLIKKGVEDNNTLLVVGGIQGDEPGGFMAASLISSHYKITKGSVWVVPNLNFDSIIKRGRGHYGDMNRKFAQILNSDPDFEDIQRVKEYIAHDNVKVVLNLHDGSGFYRKEYVDNMRSPYRWGQSSIIDQDSLDIAMYGNLGEIASRVCEHVNKHLIEKDHVYNVRNTNTKAGDKEMEKTLTYFAINQGKAAFGNEASKQFPVYKRAYYHILALEEYMRVMGIEFERDFELSLDGIKQALYEDIYISFYDDKIKLPLSAIRSELNYFPVKKDGTINFTPSNPLMTVLKDDGYYAIHYGNIRLVSLRPDYFDMDTAKEMVTLKIDGIKKEVNLGEMVVAKRNIFVQDKEGVRVNVIGYSNKNRTNESNLNIHKDEIQKFYSVDKEGKIYRIEFYKKDKFAGMILVKFEENLSVAKTEKKSTALDAM